LDEKVGRKRDLWGAKGLANSLGGGGDRGNLLKTNRGPASMEKKMVRGFPGGSVKFVDLTGE